MGVNCRYVTVTRARRRRFLAPRSVGCPSSKHDVFRAGRRPPLVYSRRSKPLPTSERGQQPDPARARPGYRYRDSIAERRERSWRRSRPTRIRCRALRNRRLVDALNPQAGARVAEEISGLTLELGPVVKSHPFEKNLPLGFLGTGSCECASRQRDDRICQRVRKLESLGDRRSSKQAQISASVSGSVSIHRDFMFWILTSTTFARELLRYGLTVPSAATVSAKPGSVPLPGVPTTSVKRTPLAKTFWVLAPFGSMAQAFGSLMRRL